jgi:hypothetical protein
MSIRRIILFNKKSVIVTIILVSATMTFVLNYRENVNIRVENIATKEPSTNKNFIEMKSIAQPNWWVKPSMTTTEKTQKQQTKQIRNSSEPISNFLILPKMVNWKQQAKKTGIASATYEFKSSENGKVDYELAIIRMNANVALSDVLSIWQSKIDSPINQLSKPSIFSTKKKQNLNIFTFKGEQKTILVAVHKKQKYTFFRLSTVQQNNKNSPSLPNKNIAQVFESFLADIYIHN